MDKNTHKINGVKDGEIIVINGHHYLYIKGEIKSVQELFDVMTEAVRNVTATVSDAFENILKNLQQKVGDNDL